MLPDTWTKQKILGHHQISKASWGSKTHDVAAGIATQIPKDGGVHLPLLLPKTATAKLKDCIADNLQFLEQFALPHQTTSILTACKPKLQADTARTHCFDSTKMSTDKPYTKIIHESLLSSHHPRWTNVDGRQAPRLSRPGKSWKHREGRDLVSKNHGFPLRLLQDPRIPLGLL